MSIFTTIVNCITCFKYRRVDLSTVKTKVNISVKARNAKGGKSHPTRVDMFIFIPDMGGLPKKEYHFTVNIKP